MNYGLRLYIRLYLIRYRVYVWYEDGGTSAPPTSPLTPTPKSPPLRALERSTPQVSAPPLPSSATPKPPRRPRSVLSAPHLKWVLCSVLPVVFGFTVVCGCVPVP